MVCKEEVFTWFRNLKGSKRIEAMCGFLNMCYPLELRFYGTCLEDLGRRDFYAIRDEEAKANNVSEILKIRNIHDPYMRSKLIVVLSLLNSSNTVCAKELFKVLSEEIKIEMLASLGILADPKLVEHYMLLLTLAQHHPAFSFSQQTYLGNLSQSLEKCAQELNPGTKYQSEESCLSSPVFPYVGSTASVSEGETHTGSNQLFKCPPLQRRSSDSSQCHVHITNLKVKGPHRKLSIRIRVAWSNDKATDILKTPKELLSFHQKLLELFPMEVKVANLEKFVVPLTQSVVSAAQLNSINETIISAVYDYIQQFNSGFPSYVFESEFVSSFFLPSHPRSALAKTHRFSDGGQSDIPPRNPRLRSLTIYNSQIAENSPGHRTESRQKYNVPRKVSENGCSRASPLTSPIQSPSSSPYASPNSSETNSRAASPWSHATGTYVDRSACNAYADPAVMNKPAKDTLPEHWDPTRSYKIEELQAMPIEELESLGIIPDSSKGKKIMDIKSPPNGLVNPFLSKSSIPAKQNLIMQQAASNDSSPTGSEYSSPPQSPIPGDASNQSNTLSSNIEENADKKNLVKAGPDLSKTDEPNSSQVVHDSSLKRPEDDAVISKGSLNRTTISLFPFPPPYTSIITNMPPPQNMKTAYIPIPCRTNNAPQHMSPGGIVFDNQFSRVPLPSALTFLSAGAARSHTVSSDRVMTTSNIPMSTISPFPVVTSGSATVPIATCCITTHKSSNMTLVSNSSVSSNRHLQKNPIMQGAEMKSMQQNADVTYVTSGFVLTSAAQLSPASCSCYTTSSARPSPAPSPSMSPGTSQQPTTVPVSLPYIMPYVFHQTIPFLQAQSPPNGFVPQPGMGNHGQTYSYALPNGLAAIPPELIYPPTFTLQSPSTQGPSGQVASPVSQCYGAFPQTAAVPMKILSCYNCGKVGHRGSECKEQTMDDLNKSGKFLLNYVPIPKIPDSHE